MPESTFLKFKLDILQSRAADTKEVVGITSGGRGVHLLGWVMEIVGCPGENIPCAHLYDVLEPS